MGMLDDVLAWMDNKRRVAGRNVSDLWNDPMGTMRQIDDRAANYNRNVVPTIQGGMLSNRPMTQDEIDTKNIDMAMSMMPMGVGHIAYHGSPHKFDKFKTEAIGTGEGAQAYGHGLYLAESPAVATEYQQAVSNAKAPELYRARSTAKGAQNDIDQITGWLNGSTPWPNNTRGQPVSKEFLEKRLKEYQDDLKWSNDLMASREENGVLYKTDIPDEAVARMLDWDKPLSQQNKFVQSTIARQHGVSLENYRKMMQLDPDKFDKTGKQWVTGNRGAQPDEVTSDLFANGIPGIRYLDGGSRSTGQGSSNFVVFDPEMIRILERNGQATGKMPWKRGEFDLKDTTYEPPLFPDTTR